MRCCAGNRVATTAWIDRGRFRDRVRTIGAFACGARADESGISYWLPGRFGSLAASPGVPGWSMAAVYYHTSLHASGAAAAAREIQVGRFPANVNVNLGLSLNAQADLVLLNPTYTFATPVLGGQLAIGVTGLFGRSSANLDGTLDHGGWPNRRRPAWAASAIP